MHLDWLKSADVRPFIEQTVYCMLYHHVKCCRFTYFTIYKMYSTLRMNTANIIFLLFFCLYQLPHFSIGISFNITTDSLELGEPKNYTLSSKAVYLIEVQNLSDIIERVPPRIFLKCEGCTENYPLLVVVILNRGIMSWELPVLIDPYDNHFLYKNIERTLCPYDILNFTKSESQVKGSEIYNNTFHPVMLSLSTSSSKNVSVELIVNLEKNFVIHLDKNSSVKVTPSTPAFYLFEFDSENVTSVILHVTSDDSTCLILSVQNVTCPVFDLEENVEYRGLFQSVTRQGGLTVTKDAFPNGFYIVLIVSTSDKYCSGLLDNEQAHERTKNVVISVTRTISSNDYNIAVGVTILVIVLFCVIMFIIFYFSITRQNIEFPNLEGEIIINEDECEQASVSQSLPYNVTSPGTPITPAATTSVESVSIKTDSSLDENDFDLLNDAELDKNIYRMKNLLYLSDLSRKNQSVLKKKSELYFWNLLTVAIFYFLPVFQLVFNDQYRVNQSGKEDLCYYNFLCSHPLWVFSDFNHMFSNIGYISFGTLFMFLTVLKERDYRFKISKDRKLCRYYGIPQHFGIFYAMGAALIIEGILSLCYHICPNHYNFQFDTSFMYVISTLCMIKIYQTRHPDINASAYATFSLLAGVILLGMYGVFSSSLSFWILFTIAHLSTCTYLSLQIYYIGRFKLEFINVVRWFNELQPCRNCQLRFFLPMFPSRFTLLVIANACNWGLAVGSFVYNIKSFSSYLLTIFMVNLVLYTAFYIVMKFICKEKLSLQSIIYILLAMLCWASALYFFFSRTISWRLTPAESKLFNQKCKLLNFYDNHDIWHFISATAMFFSFMVLLTLDDDLFYVPRSKIVVF